MECKPRDTRKHRDPNIEFLRVVCMFGIVLLHAINNSGHQYSCLGGPLHACVCCFVFISGWYGMRFSIAKLIKLYGIGLWCSLVSFAILEWHDFGAISFTSAKFHEFAAFFCKGNWFLHAYAFMMMVVPMVNHVCDEAMEGDLAKKRAALVTLAPFFLLAFGWSAADHTPGLSLLMWPQASGIGDYTPLTLIGIYAAARVVKMYGIADRIRTRYLLLSMIALGFLATVGFSAYNTLVQVAQGACLFALFSRINLRADGLFSKAAVLLAPSMFSVFLLHAHSRVFSIMDGLESSLLSRGLGIWPTYLLVAILTFTLSCLIDMVRRFAVHCCLMLRLGHK